MANRTVWFVVGSNDGLAIQARSFEILRRAQSTGVRNSAAIDFAKKGSLLNEQESRKQAGRPHALRFRTRKSEVAELLRLTSLRTRERLQTIRIS
jgi:hypothetical protein